MKGSAVEGDSESVLHRVMLRDNSPHFTSGQSEMTSTFLIENLVKQSPPRAIKTDSEAGKTFEFIII